MNFSDKDIARFAELDTPFYYYDLNLLQATLDKCASHANAYNFHVHYAMKANFNPTLVSKIKAMGFGADAVSGGEVRQAIELGFPAGQVVFAGVGKSNREINYALEQDIFCFNVESIQELEVINELAAKKDKIAKVAIRINPNVDAHTHHNITTGLDENKFGINSWDLPACATTLKNSANLEFIGIHFHIGSQITNLDVYKNLCVRVNEFATWFEERGFNVRVLNVGGGLGIDYHNPDQQIPDFENYFKIFQEFLEIKTHQEVHFELGRALVGQCSSVISEVLYVKNGKKKNFIVLDVGMTELMRPALYQAFHKIENISRPEVTAQISPDHQNLNAAEKAEDALGSDNSAANQNLADFQNSSYVQNSADNQYLGDSTIAEVIDTRTNIMTEETVNDVADTPGTHDQADAIAAGIVKYDVVGPICESTDCFGKEVELPETFRGDLIAIRSTGAYGEVMASNYNLRENVRVAFSE